MRRESSRSPKVGASTVALNGNRSLHWCSECAEEGFSDVDSEGRDCFEPLMQTIQANAFHTKDLEASESMETPSTMLGSEDVNGTWRETAFGIPSNRSSGRRMSREWNNDAVSRSRRSNGYKSSFGHHVPRHVQDRYRDPSGNSRSMAIVRLAEHQHWSYRLHPSELPTATSGSHRRARLVNDWRRSHPLIRTIFDIFLIDEKRVLVRPVFRGKFHILALYLSPFWSWHFIIKDSLHPLSSWITTIALIIGLIFSVILHNTNPRCLTQYKKYRRLDHIGILMMCCFSTMPVVAHLSRPTVLQLHSICMFAIFTAGFLAIEVFNALRLDATKRVPIFALIGISQFIVILLELSRLTTLEISLGVIFGIIILFGGICFGLRWPRINPDVFSFHEVFHLCTIISKVLLLIWIKSVIQRTTTRTL